MLTKESSKYVKPKASELMNVVKVLPKILKKQKNMRKVGYKFDNIFKVLQNDPTERTILYTLKDIYPKVNELKENIFFVGSTVESDKNYYREKEDKKRVYISLGTINNNSKEFYENCMEALGDMDVEVIMSIGRTVDKETFKNIPDNFSVHNFVNQIEVLKSCDLFISHAGMNSVHESLYFGVPLILYPRQSEQGLVARSIKEYGAGVVLEGSSKEEIRDKVKLMLESNEYKKKASILSNKLKDKKALENVTRFIYDTKVRSQA